MDASISNRIRKEMTSFMSSPDGAELTTDQRRALDALASGTDTFLTGGGGVGKSYVLKAFLTACENAGANVIATASTGIAAVALGHGAQTLNRAFALGFATAYGLPTVSVAGYDVLPKDRYCAYADKARGGGLRPLFDVGTLEVADVVVIDEISMCRIDTFSAVMHSIRKSEKRWKRRIQVVVSGDFLQLPPVVKKEDRPLLSALYPTFSEGWCFESDEWSRRSFATVVMKEPIRQSDPTLVRELDRARWGKASCLPYFTECVGTKAASDAIILVPTNAKANAINAARFEALSGAMREYDAVTRGDVKPSEKGAPDVLYVKLGMRVMATFNSLNIEEYQNGSIGTVCDFDENGVTVLFDGSDKPVLMHEHTWETTRQTIETLPDGRRQFKQEILGTFSQIPLKPAYAITIHKSQGQTYDELVVHPDCFAEGQLYVALSRARGKDGLHIAGDIPRTALMVSETVKAFYKSLGECEPE